MDMIQAARQLKGGAQLPVHAQLRVASALVDAISNDSVGEGAKAQTEQIVLRHLRERVLGWIADTVRKGTLTSSLFKGRDQDERATGTDEGVPSELELFWKMIFYLISRSRRETAAASAAAAAATATTTAAVAASGPSVHETTARISPALASSLCTLMCQTVEYERTGANAVKLVGQVFSSGFGLDIHKGSKVRASNLTLPPEEYVRFVVRMLQGLRLKCTVSCAAQNLLSVLLRGLRSWMASQSNERKAYKLTADYLLVPLLQMRQECGGGGDGGDGGDGGLHHGKSQPQQQQWAAKCTKHIDSILRQALFSGQVLSSMETSLQAALAMTGVGDSTAPDTTSTSTQSGAGNKRPRKRQKRSSSNGNSTGHASFHRSLFATLSGADVLCAAATGGAAETRAPSEKQAMALCESAFPALFTLLIDAAVDMYFASRNDGSVQSSAGVSDHDRTQAVQRLSFKFFAELYALILPSSLSSSSSSSASAKASTTPLIFVRTLGRLVDILWRRKVFMRGSSHAKILAVVVEQLVTTAQAHVKDATADATTEQMVPSFASLLARLLTMDHRLLVPSFSTWVACLHTWASSAPARLESACAYVFAVAVQSFAKVRQLDQFFELVVSTLRLYSKQNAHSGSASGWLFVSPAAQAALEASIVSCPAGQVQLLWNILSAALTLQSATTTEQRAQTLQSTVTLSTIFRCFGSSVDVARHNAEFFDNAACKHGAAAALEIQACLRAIEATSSSKKVARAVRNTSALVVQLEALSILRERCQLYLPGARRRMFVADGNCERIPSLFRAVDAAPTDAMSVDDADAAADVVGDDSSVDLVDVLTKLSVISLREVLQSSSKSALRESQALSFAMSVKRLAVRRMFVLHPFATMPGNSGEHSRSLARPELERLAALVFEGCSGSEEQLPPENQSKLRESSLALIASHVELVCQYASVQDKLSFLRWLVEFDALESESKTAQNLRQRDNDEDNLERHGNNNSNVTAIMRSSISDTWVAPRIALLTRPSFYELRDVGTLLLGVLGDKLGKALANVFPNATVASLPFFVADSNCFDRAPMQLAAILGSSRVEPSVDIPNPSFYDVHVPMIKSSKGNKKAYRNVMPGLRGAQLTLQFVLGLPSLSAYFHDFSTLHKFMSLVVQMDMALFAVREEDLRSTNVESCLVSTRAFLASVASRHPAFFFEGPGLGITEWLIFSVVCCTPPRVGEGEIGGEIASWKSLTLGMLKGLMSQAVVWKYAGVLSSFSLLLSLWDSSRKSSSMRAHIPSILSVSQSLAEGVSVALKKGPELDELREQVPLCIYSSALGWSTNRKKLKKRKKSKKKNKNEKTPDDFRLGYEELRTSLFGVMQDILQRATGDGSEAYWTVPENAASLIFICQACLESSRIVATSESAAVPVTGTAKPESILRRGVMAAGDAFKHPRLVTALMRFLKFYCGTHEIDEQELGELLALALGLSHYQYGMKMKERKKTMTRGWHSAISAGDVFCARAAFSQRTKSSLPHMMNMLLLELRPLNSDCYSAESTSSHEAYPMTVIALDVLNTLLKDLRSQQQWVIISRSATRILGAIASLSQSWIRIDQDAEWCRRGLTSSINILVTLLRKKKDVQVGTRGLTLSLQTLMFWDTLQTSGTMGTSSLSLLNADIINASYFALSAMLEHRPFALYGCASAFVLIVRGMLRTSFALFKLRSASGTMGDGTAASAANGAVLMRFTSRLFEDMSKTIHRKALRHYSVHLLCDVVSAILGHGWFDETRADLKRGLFALLDACTEYQTQMLYAGLDNSGRSLLRKLRTEYSRQSYQGEL